jgi:hypothetical protein
MARVQRAWELEATMAIAEPVLRKPKKVGKRRKATEVSE